MLGNRNYLIGYDPGESRNKIRVFKWLVSCAFLLLIFRLGNLQVFRGDELRQRSEDNRIRVQEIKPLRGLIMDAYGEILVDNQPSFDISIIPEIAKDVELVKDKLADLCNWEEGTLLFETASQPSGKLFVPVRVAKNIGRYELAAVATNLLDLPGVVVDVVPVREYTYGKMMAHILGYVGEISAFEMEGDVFASYRAGDIIGKYGIEKYLKGPLRGKSGGQQVEVDAAGKKTGRSGKDQFCSRS